MKTDVIRITGEEGRMEAALEQTEKVAAYKELSAKNALQLRLLTEEMMGLMRSITGKPEGDFWIEDNDGAFELHLKVRAGLTEDRREQLLSSATSGRNEAAKGLMGRLRAFFEPISSAPAVHVGLVAGGSPQMFTSMVWSMDDYREQLREGREAHLEGAEEAWDELEKSVVAHVADNVKVSIRGREIEMTILKIIQ